MHSISLFLVVLLVSPFIVIGQSCPSTPCAPGLCCSQWGYCGSGDLYCGAGCKQNCPASAATGNTVSTTGNVCSPGNTVSCSASTPCPSGYCCSQYGHCGQGPEYCGIASVTTAKATSASVTSAHATSASVTSAHATTASVTSAHATTASVTSAKATSASATSAKATSASVTSAKATSTSTTSAASSTTGSRPGTWPGGPVKAMYIDSGINWNDPSITFKAAVDAGYNLVILAFFVSGTAWDAIVAWGQMSAATQQSVLAYAHSKNARIILSAGGATDVPYDTFTGTAYGTALANMAKSYNLDGVDFDLENFGWGFTAGSRSVTDSIQWVADATNAARSVLGSSAIITHAPQPPYFGVSAGFNNAYVQIYQKAPSIDFLLVQYYNNGPSETYADIFTSTPSGVSAIIALGIPKSKIVVGKPVIIGDAQNFVSAGNLAAMFATAKNNLGWNGGVMGWQWHDSTTNANWINAISSGL